MSGSYSITRVKSRRAHNAGKRRFTLFTGRQTYQKPEHRTLARWQAAYFLTLSITASVIAYTQHPKFTTLLSPVPQTYAATFTQTVVEEKIVEVEVDRQFTTEKQQIIALITEVFGDDAPRAIAVAKAESGLNPNRENRGTVGSIPRLPNYKGECSIGLFQINLASDGCQGAKVHWAKVPGETLDEKIAWLKVPKNNISLAKKIYDSAGKSFQPWGAYTSGAYKNL